MISHIFLGKWPRSIWSISGEVLGTCGQQSQIRVLVAFGAGLSVSSHALPPVTNRANSEREDWGSDRPRSPPGLIGVELSPSFDLYQGRNALFLLSLVMFWMPSLSGYKGHQTKVKVEWNGNYCIWKNRTPSGCTSPEKVHSLSKQNPPNEQAL